MKILPIGTTAVVAKVDASLSSIFTSDNTKIVYVTLNGVYKSWKPGKISAFNSIQKGFGYIVTIDDEVDVTDYFADADDIGGGGAGELATTLNVINSHNSNLNVYVIDATNDFLFTLPLAANKNGIINLELYPTATRVQVNGSGAVNYAKGTLSADGSTNTVEKQSNYPLNSGSNIGISDLTKSTILYIETYL